MKKYLLILTISLMTLSCNENKEPKASSNILLSEWTTPYNTPPFDQIKNEDYLPAFKSAIEQNRLEIDAIVNSKEAPSFANTIEAMEMAGGSLSKVANIFFNLNEAETNDTMQAIGIEVSPLLSDLSSDIYLNEKLFERVNTVYQQASTLGLNAEQQKLLENCHRAFVRSGANLSAKDKEEFRAISKELGLLNLKFGQNILNETNAYTMHLTQETDIKGLPAGAAEAAKAEAKERNLEGWVITMQQTSVDPFLKYADNRALRETIYREYASRGAKANEFSNIENIKKIVNLRLRMANLLGFSSYAEYSLKESMAQNIGRVDAMFTELLTASKPFAVRDVAEVQAFAKKSGFQTTLMPWDFGYYSEKLKAEKYSLDEEMTRPYFQLDKVVNGVFDLSNRLFDLKFTLNTEIPVYHPDVKAYEVSDASGKFIAILYLDFFPRASKRGGAWMTNFREQSKMGTTDQRPWVSLVCNFTKPTDSKPSLLTFREVETFLHEFGHGLHGMLSEVQYESLAGTNVYRDFVELPSQMMENWATEKEFLDLFAQHYETGEVIPSTMIEKIINSRNYLEGYLSMRQLNFGKLDMAYHTITNPFDKDVAAFERTATAETQVLPVVDGALASPAFSHVFAGGYAAGYYSYKWSEELDADAFSLFKANGIFDKVTAKSFQTNILSKGGTQDPMVLYVAFRGQEPTAEALLVRSGFKR